MSCTCGGETVVRPWPAPLADVFEEAPSAVRLCQRCLRVEPAPGEAVDLPWEPGEASGALPADPDAAVALGGLVTFLSSLALYRGEIEVIVAYLEARGVDPLLALDRLGTAPLLEPDIELDRRRHQLAQVLKD